MLYIKKGRVKSVFVLTEEEMADYFCKCVDSANTLEDQGYNAMAEEEWKMAHKIHALLDSVGHFSMGKSAK